MGTRATKRSRAALIRNLQIAIQLSNIPHAVLTRLTRNPTPDEIETVIVQQRHRCVQLAAIPSICVSTRHLCTVNLRLFTDSQASNDGDMNDLGKIQ
jgi:hypothetical protein